MANVVIVSQGLLYVKSLATLSHIFLTLFIPPLGIVLQGQLWLLQRYILLWYKLWNIFFKNLLGRAILCLALYVHTTNIFENVRGPSHTIPVIPISEKDLSCIARIQCRVPSSEFQLTVVLIVITCVFFCLVQQYPASLSLDLLPAEVNKLKCVIKNEKFKYIF